ncbi:MAG: polysaccharide biosynthesis/export family protein [Bacteroidaceae bacterium]|nr:polysaccharide biosynthesis/export family protein [Bacteroidaceae bacterium]
MKIKFSFNILLLLVVLSAAVSCTSYKRVPYLQNSEELQNMVQKAELYDARIQPKDLLNIVVVSPKNYAASMEYNLTVPRFSGSNIDNLTSQPVLQSYLVDNDGNIEFPVLGTLKVAGLTKSELEKMILDRIKDSFTEKPVVTVRFSDFKISVIGEVASPGTYTINNEKVNVFEALALAKDMTVYGERDNVKLIREDASGKKEIHNLNLNDVSIITSPYYYLQQNDVLYVTPNKAKARNSDIGSSTTLWFSATSIAISLVSLLYNILN